MADIVAEIIAGLSVAAITALSGMAYRLVTQWAKIEKNVVDLVEV